MITTAGVTKAHPVKCSELATRCRTGPLEVDPLVASPLLASRATSARRQGLVDLLGGGGQRRRRLALAEQHRAARGAGGRGELRVLRAGAPGLVPSGRV